VACSPNNNPVVTGGDDAAQIWEIPGGQLVRVLDGHTPNAYYQRVNSVGFSADGSKVLTSSEDGRTRLWDASDLAVRLAHASKANGTLHLLLDANGVKYKAPYARPRVPGTRLAEWRRRADIRDGPSWRNYGLSKSHEQNSPSFEAGSW
jgi:WD40 repeat protein